jgi:hypothetical protein
MGTKKPHFGKGEVTTVGAGSLWPCFWASIIQRPPAHHQLDAHYDCCGETSAEFMSGFTLVTHSVSRSTPVLYWYICVHG